jgi:hypothetical protein
MVNRAKLPLGLPEGRLGVVVRVGTDGGVTAARKSVEPRQHGFQNWFISFVRR